MSVPDLIIVVLLFLFALSGIFRGAVWELLTSIGLSLGFALTYYFRAELLDLAMRLTSPGWQRQWVGGIVFLAFFLILYLGFATIGKQIHEAIKKTPLKWVDHVLGFAAGALKGAVLIAVLVMAIEWVDGTGRARAFLYDSKLIRWGKQTAQEMIRWEPPARRKWAENESKDEGGRMKDESPPVN